MQAELAQLELVDGDVGHNTRKVIETIGRANVAGGTKLVVFPEATLSGFPTRENVSDVAQSLDGPALTAVRDAARQRRVSVAVGLAEREGARFYNTTVLVDDKGEIALRYRKTHLWASDVGVFTPGDRFETCLWNGLTRRAFDLLRHRIPRDRPRGRRPGCRPADRHQRQHGSIRPGASASHYRARNGEPDVRAHGEPLRHRRRQPHLPRRIGARRSLR